MSVVDESSSGEWVSYSEHSEESSMVIDTAAVTDDTYYMALDDTGDTYLHVSVYERTVVSSTDDCMSSAYYTTAS